MVLIPKSTRTRLFLAVVASILLGALGSGIWEYVLEPVFQGTRDFLLNVASLGITKFKDQLYKEIATDASESVALQILSHTFYIYIAILVAGSVLVISARKYIQDNIREAQDEIDSMRKKLDSNVPQVEKEARNPEQIHSELEKVQTRLEQLPMRRLSVFVYTTVLAASLLVTWASVSFVRVGYIHNARTHFQQLITLVAPYIDDQQEQRFRAQFASVIKKDDFVAVIDSLRFVLVNADHKPPSFSIW